ncbi:MULTISPECIES: class I SAM-dependent methyltransferase [unclassified Modestobacter]|uniref:class I SAM-dependent methyltransferase n=1 Tax=unclassified Modestobacter TaxID=2643866 RepID=UPI0022AB0904|nr:MULTISPECIES: methyltransferase domain-containing protein [unclassified Modestobacter]MCZ2826923.1 methyltransferase domain-containing protein [Modestobacter sp. VKM Ac-2981]MCZ2855381.1 methyltransferase domain-containing protein [Modestobacter sp. VKM Ac-2982]
MTIGAVAASGRALTRAAIAPVPTGAAVVVVELGPGTGAMTTAIEQRLAGRGRQLAIEVNARLARALSTRHPAVAVVQADAAELGTVLTDRGIAHADVVVSGLPWAAFRPQQQAQLLDAMVTGLSPDGVFTTFAYVHSRWTPAARRFRRELEARFEEVLIGRTVWRNLPPALVYYARRPTTAGRGTVRDQLRIRSARRRSWTSSSRLCPST